VTTLSTELGPKQLELLHEVVHDAGKIGLLVNPKNPGGTEAIVQITQAAGRRLGLEIAVVNAGTVEEIDLAFAILARQGVGALVVGQDAFFLARREQVAALALRHRMPTVISTRPGAEAGALISYGSLDSSSRQAGIYVGRILKGANPGNLPVVQPTKFESSISRPPRFSV
jgi:putative tryptophan/tyrosine transport system substrate-binding protein